jgi:hypothetical protein|tara:strand:+ start:1231 stop:1404 length:174 start_codon:yes stop_codon:yes gene_type:complete
MLNRIIIVSFVLLVSCSSINRKLETHPTNNSNSFENLNKFWKALKPLRLANGIVDIN